MAKELTTVELTSNHYEVYAGESNKIGELIRDVDGFFYFKFDGRDGLWGEYSLKLIIRLLATMNKEWSDYIDKNLNN